MASRHVCTVMQTSQRLSFIAIIDSTILAESTSVVLCIVLLSLGIGNDTGPSSCVRTSYSFDIGNSVQNWTSRSIIILSAFLDFDFFEMSANVIVLGFVSVSQNLVILSTSSLPVFVLFLRSSANFPIH